MIAQPLDIRGRCFNLIGISVFAQALLLILSPSTSAFFRSDDTRRDDATRLIGPGWSQKTITGELCSWDPTAKAHVICVLGCECPVARFYANKLQSMAKEFDGKGVLFLAVMGLIQDDIPKIEGFLKETEISFPVIRDEEQIHLTNLRATRTPEVFVLDQNGDIVYRGRIDDQMAPGVKKNQASTKELIDALDAVIANRPVSSPTTAAAGCLITYRNQSVVRINQATPSETSAQPSVRTELEKSQQEPAAPTYATDIAPIFYKHCYDCHRPGDIGPFDISQVDEIRGWGDMIVEVIENGRMPPWHASPDHGEFRNARSLSAAEKETIRTWVAAGSPLGDLDQLPEPPIVKTGWQLPTEPDLIVPMRESPYTVPPTGTVEYQYFVVDPKLTEDRWIKAAQVIPGNASIVHHAIVFIRPPDGEPIKGVSWLTSFVP
nr:redoxin domain-containing protein [Pirellula sp.]